MFDFTKEIVDEYMTLTNWFGKIIILPVFLIVFTWSLFIGILMLGLKQ